MDSISKIRAILTKPRWFFSHVKEKTLTDAFVLYASLLAISVILGTIIGLLTQDFTARILSNWLGFPSPAQRMGALAHIALTISGYVFGLVGSFIIAGILHVWIMIFGGKEDYVRTYQLRTYAQVPTLLFSWIPGIGSFAWIYSLALLIIGTQEMHKIPRRTAILMYLVPVAIMIVFVLLLLLLFLHLAPTLVMAMKQAAVQR